MTWKSLFLARSNMEMRLRVRKKLVWEHCPSGSKQQSMSCFHISSPLLTPPSCSRAWLFSHVQESLWGWFSQLTLRSRCHSRYRDVLVFPLGADILPTRGCSSLQENPLDLFSEKAAQERVKSGGRNRRRWQVFKNGTFDVGSPFVHCAMAIVGMLWNYFDRRY